jgi:hypothetical protein
MTRITNPLQLVAKQTEKREDSHITTGNTGVCIGKAFAQNVSVCVYLGYFRVISDRSQESIASAAADTF